MHVFFFNRLKFELLRESWHELFILTAAQYFSDTDIFLLLEEHRSNFGSLDIEEQTTLFKNTLTTVKHRQVDPIEQYLLNEIILLKAGKIFIHLQHASVFKVLMVFYVCGQNRSKTEVVQKTRRLFWTGYP
jgi:hypothetical protein